jgi:hypothetical protein
MPPSLTPSGGGRSTTPGRARWALPCWQLPTRLALRSGMNRGRPALDCRTACRRPSPTRSPASLAGGVLEDGPRRPLCASIAPDCRGQDTLTPQDGCRGLKAWRNPGEIPGTHSA